MDESQYSFDPSYGYTIEQLLTVRSPKAPKDFDDFFRIVKGCNKQKNSDKAKKIVR